MSDGMDDLGGQQGFLKAGFLGFTGSGKTYTAIDLAIGTRAHMQSPGPIAMYDTESGSVYIAAKVYSATGKPLVGKRSRSFDALMATARQAEKIGASIFVVDSITHVWRELCDAHLEALNEALAAKRKPKRLSLEFQDWGPIKARWQEWVDWYLNSPMHVIVCGRAGYEYDEEPDERTGRKKLVKTGTKMKVEGEFGFEASLLIEMERVVTDKRGKATQVNRALVLKDRWDLINGKTFDKPTFADFLPHVAKLTPGAHAVVDTTSRSQADIDDQGADPWIREQRQRKIVCEEIQAELVRRWPSRSASDLTGKSDCINELFRTRSWTQVESTDSKQLRAGLIRLRAVGDAIPAGEERERRGEVRDRGDQDTVQPADVPSPLPAGPGIP